MSEVASGSPDGCDKAYKDWNNSAALKKCEFAAKAGNADAEFGYGLVLWSGPPQGIDHSAALDWLRKSARQGHWLAQVSLGTFLQIPDLEAGLRNKSEAFAWLVTAGASKEAARLRPKLSDSEIREADRLASEFGLKYPLKRPLQGGT
jgi:TPR repeat protein